MRALRALALLVTLLTTPAMGDGLSLLGSGSGGGGGGVTSFNTRTGAVTLSSADVTTACTTCALTTNPLSQFASTTSAQLFGVLSNPTGSGGAAVFATGPTISALTVTGSLTATGLVTNADLVNSSMTLAGHVVALGGTQAIACADLSNGATGCSTATGTSGATLCVLNGAACTFASAPVVPANSWPLSSLAQIATNTVLVNATAGTANVTAQNVATCSTSASALNWTTNTGFGCNSAVNAAQLGGATFASPGAIGGSTPAAITGTTIAATTNFSSTGTTAPTLAAGTIGMCAACSPTISANGEGMFYESTIQGAILSGKGSTADSAIANSAGGMALEVLTGTVNLQTGGTLTMGGIINMVSSNITNAANILGNNANGFEALGNTASSATVPTLVPTKADTTSGLGGVANHATLIAQNTTALDTTSALVSSALAVTFSNATITLSGITTGTNADFLCRTAGGVVLIQTSSCTISSLRFKENWHDFDGDALGEIARLEVGTFTFKQKFVDGNGDPNAGELQIGLNAENVASVDPRCTIYEDNMRTPKSYRQECMIGLIVAGMKQLIAERPVRLVGLVP